MRSAPGSAASSSSSVRTSPWISESPWEDVLPAKIDVDYVYQDIADLPGGFKVPEGREKPWGTGHAILAARDSINGHFAVINADDFYGRDSYERASEFFSRLPDGNAGEVAMVGYPLLNTLSAHGHVNRGICETDASGSLTGVEEYVNIQREQDGILYGNALDGTRRAIAADTIVSMNFWIFGSDFFAHLEKSFLAFLEKSGSEMKSEFYIPTVVDELIVGGEVKCPVLQTSGRWFGVTYPEDKPAVIESIAGLVAAGEYPESLS